MNILQNWSVNEENEKLSYQFKYNIYFGMDS
jgi:hypothetical protein